MNSKSAFYLLTFVLFIKNIGVGQSLDKYAIKNVTVIPMNKEVVLPGQTVVIENWIIKAIDNTKNIPVDKGVTVIDCNVKYLIPGLFDMHAHFFYEQGEHRNTCETELKMMLANGLTTARILAGHLFQFCSTSISMLVLLIKEMSMHIK